jgi:hypothetical protein
MSARPGIQLFSGLLAIALGLGFSLLVLFSDGPTAEAAVPLCFVGFGVVWILVMTDARHTLRRGDPDTESGKDDA